MSTSLILIEGVLRKEMGGQPIQAGIRLYRSLLATGRVVLLSTAESDADQASISDWLELHGCTAHSTVMWGDVGPRVSLANMLRREGYDIELIVDPDPETVMTLIAAGFNTLLFTHAKYSRPDWRPDHAKGIIPWTAITDRVAESARLKAADSRLRNDE